MKIVIAMDSFKGTMTSPEAGETVRSAFLSVFPDAEAEVVCVADGGEGTAHAMVSNMGGEMRRAIVSDPLGRPVTAEYGISGDTAVIEMASASGLPLLAPDEYDPFRATTYGTGELMRRALDEGARRIVLGLGGSATNDGGAGMAQALGASLRDAGGKEIARGGYALRSLAEVDLSGLDPRLRSCEVIAACDVSNPLCGARGATRVYGPQKGVREDQVAALDEALGHLAEVCAGGREIAAREGAGAAGGLGFGLMYFCGASVAPGIETVLEAAGLDEKAAHADFVITGEGSIDAQTVFGKTPVGVAAYAERHGVPTIAIAGQSDPGYEAVFEKGIDVVLTTIDRNMSREEILSEGRGQLHRTAVSAAKLMLLGARCADGAQAPSSAGGGGL
jgi:glycerate kinase